MKLNIELVEAKRDQLGYTQLKMAELMGYSHRTTYSYKIQGKRKITLNDISKIATILKLNLTEIITMEGDKI